MILSKFLIAFCFILFQVYGLSQKPEYDLPQHTNEDFLYGEPEECLPQSLIVPQNLRENILDKGIMFKWDPVPVTFGCQIKGGPINAEERTRIIEGYEIKRLYYSFNSLLPNTNYRWKVRCACKTEPVTYGDYSEYKYFTTPNFGLPYDPDQADLIVLFPNPTSNELNLHYNMEASEDASMNIYSVSGILVMSLPLKSGLNYIDTTELQKGYYILNVESNNERKKLSFVKS